MRFVLVALLLLAVSLTGCASTCTLAAAYTIPAHWIPGHYQPEQQYSWADGKYHWVRVYLPPTYTPTQHVPAVVCGTSS